MEKVHKVVNAISGSPIVNTVRTLFSAENTEVQSTQNKRTCDKIPQRRIDKSFQCHVCKKDYITDEELIEHIKIHDVVALNADKNATTEDDDEVAQELANMANMIEEGLISEEENLIELRNMEMVDRIVDTFVDIAFREMNPDQQTVSVHVECEECKNKSEKIASYSKKNEDNEEIITEKLAAVSGLILKVKNMTEERKEINKKLNETETLKKLVADKKIRQ